MGTKRVSSSSKSSKKGRLRSWKRDSTRSRTSARRECVKARSNTSSNGVGGRKLPNTWEPFENLKFCADFIEAFEEKSRSRKSSGRKRCRRGSGLNNAFVKKKPCSFRGEEIPALTEHNSDVCEGESTEKDHEEENQVTEEVELNGFQDIDDQKEDGNKESGRISVQLNEEEGWMEDGSSKIECTQPVGSKKRKSGSVRRFKQDLHMEVQDEARDVAPGSEKLGNEDVDSNENEEEIGNKAIKLYGCANLPPAHHYQDS
ncbi:hypothetical protein HPP92_025872 [Vanilla planifolia]|uniref:Uncharacterized protein n=1 Tax=Vanilla planifolia TaxID=51239 RepID=A0A835U876_VANPL|nr:hypothetical protein HPP92_026156 [Vanilla planifolia]KAG0452061.1 hypothetical protein HPP92_025872 [Vanilla planifolia]